MENRILIGIEIAGLLAFWWMMRLRLQCSGVRCQNFIVIWIVRLVLFVSLVELVCFRRTNRTN